jgi:hypothetical protein
MAIVDTRLLSRKQIVGVALEAAPGTAETLGDGSTFSWVPCYDLSITPEVGFIERDLMSASLAPEQSDAVGTQYARVTLTVDVIGDDTAVGASATATNAQGYNIGTPQWLTLLEGCGFQFGFTPAVGWKGYSALTTTFDGRCWNYMIPSNSPVQATESSHAIGDSEYGTLSIVYWQDGRQYIVSGAMGNVTFTAPAGDIPKASFEFLGVLKTANISASATIPGHTYDSANAVAVSRNSKTAVETIKVAGLNYPAISTWELNMNNSYDIYKDVNAVGAGTYACIYERKPTLTFTNLSYTGSVVADLQIDDMLNTDTGYFQSVLGVAPSSEPADAAQTVQSFLFGVRKSQAVSLDTGEETGYSTETQNCKLIADGTDLGDREFFLAYGRDVELAFTLAAIQDPTTGT